MDDAIAHAIQNLVGPDPSNDVGKQLASDPVNEEDATMLQSYHAAQPGGLLPVRLAKAATRATRTVMTDSVRIGARAVSETRSGRPATKIALMAAQEGWRTGTEVVEIASAFAVPGAQSVQRAMRTAADAVRPAAELAAGSAATVGTTVSTFATMSKSDIRQDLRKRGQDLLRRSTALDDPDEHPAFRYILSSLAPDEARIIRHLAISGPMPIVDVVEMDGARRSGHEVCHNVSLIGAEAGCIRPALAPVYLDNLARLGVVAITHYPVAPEPAYELLLAQPEIDGLPRVRGLFTRRKVQYKGAKLSEFGLSLYNVCFAEAPSVPKPRHRSVPQSADPAEAVKAVQAEETAEALRNP